MKVYLLLIFLCISLTSQVWTFSSLPEGAVHRETMFEIAMRYIAGNGEFLKVLDPYMEDEEGKIALEELIDIINDNGTDEGNETTPICTGCRAAVTALKAIAAANEWPEVREVVLDVCFFLFDNLTGGEVPSDVLCPGVIDLQGPHIYEVVLPKYRKSPEDVCRNLNMCFPPKENDTNVQEKVNVRRRSHHTGRKSLRERKLDALKVVQLADIHIEPDYTEGTETDCGLPVCCIPDYGPGDANRYGDYKCNIPIRTMELFLTKTASFDPSFVLFSGDTPPHAVWEETYDSQLNCTAILTNSMSQILSNYNVYPNIGNHEMYPTNLYSMEYLENYTTPMNEEFANMWENLADFSQENIETMMRGGYYSTSAFPGVRIISINTNYWYSFNWYSILHEGGPEVAAMMEFLENSLQEARDSGEKVILMGHHPPGGGDAIVVYTRALEDLIIEFSDILIMHVAGHTHNDEYNVLHSGDTPVAVMWTSPPVTSLAKNPSMRVFYLDSDTLEVIDYEKYGYSLPDVIASGETPNITLQYSAVEEYGLADMSAESWSELSSRMESDLDLFNRYYFNYVGRDEAEECDEACRVSEICGTRYYSFDEYFECAQNSDTL